MVTCSRAKACSMNGRRPTEGAAKTGGPVVPESFRSGPEDRPLAYSSSGTAGWKSCSAVQPGNISSRTRQWSG